MKKIIFIFILILIFPQVLNAETLILSYFIKENNQTKWILWNPQSDKSRTYGIYDNISNIIFDNEKSRVIYEKADGIYQDSWPNGNNEKLILRDLPIDEIKKRGWGFWWIDKNTNKFMRAYLEEVNESNQKEYDRLVEKYKFEFTWLGVLYICHLDELQKDSKWKSVTKRPTNAEAGDTLGFLVIDEFINVKGKSYTSYLDESTNLKAVHLKDKFKYLGEREKNNIYSIFNIKKEDINDFTYIEYLPLKNEVGIAVKIEFGDSPHYVEPVVFCQENCKKVKIIDDLSIDLGQLGISFREDYLLISEEYSGYDPYIYNVGNFKLIKNIPGAIGAIWLKY